MPRAAGRFDHWGAGHVHTFPNEGSANGTVVFQPGDIIVLPYCRYVQDEVRLDDPRRLHPQDRRRARRQADERLARRQPARGPTTWTATPSRISAGASIRRRAGTRIALNGADPKRHHAGARCFAGNFLFSTGPNSQGGGKRTTKGHYDVPMRDCTVTLDNDVIIERGKIADDKMRVMRVAR